MSSNKKSKGRKARRKSRLSIENLYPALRNTKDGYVYGYINDRGVFIIKPSYTRAYDFNSDGLAIIEMRKKFGLINKKGEFVVEPIYDMINPFKEKRAIFTLKHYMGVMDEEGKVITNKKYTFISNYNDRRAIIGVSSSYRDYKYGYINLDGNEIISPVYKEANEFNEGVALVKVQDDEYRLIGTYGKIINKYKFGYVSQYDGGLMIFGNSIKGPLGYINKEGHQVIKQKYKRVKAFRNEVAVVSESDNFNGPYGLVNKVGRYIYETIFNDIKVLGEGRVALGMPIGEEGTQLRSIYAIGDIYGTILTNFKYLVVGDYKNGLAYASDETDTFFIDKTGNLAKGLPKVSGSGELVLKDKLIYANIDYLPYYLNMSGEILYKPNSVIILDVTHSVLKEKYKPNINYLVYNPLVQGIKDTRVEDEINRKLKGMSCFSLHQEEGKSQKTIITEDDVLNYDYYGDFKIKYFKKKLLILEIDSYYYQRVTDHGIPSMKTPSIDLATGKFYELGDLFMGWVNWTGELNRILEKMVETEHQYDYVFGDSFKGIKSEQDFYIDNANLYIYFSPNEIEPCSVGVITFKIPFYEIQKMINKNGDFYKAFN